MFQLVDVTWMLASVSALTSLVLWLWPPVASSFALILGAAPAESGKVVRSSTVATVFAISWARFSTSGVWICATTVPTCGVSLVWGTRCLWGFGC